NPLLIRPETDLSGKVDRDVNAEARRSRHRIDEARKGGALRHCEIAAFDNVAGRDQIRRKAVDICGHLLRVKPRRINEVAAADCLAARADLKPVPGRGGPLERRCEGDLAAVILDLANVREHKLVTVDNTRGGGEERGFAKERGLQSHRLGGGEWDKIDN